MNPNRFPFGTAKPPPKKPNGFSFGPAKPSPESQKNSGGLFGLAKPLFAEPSLPPEPQKNSGGLFGSAKPLFAEPSLPPERQKNSGGLFGSAKPLFAEPSLPPEPQKISGGLFGSAKPLFAEPQKNSGGLFGSAKPLFGAPPLPPEPQKNSGGLFRPAKPLFGAPSPPLEPQKKPGGSILVSDTKDDNWHCLRSRGNPKRITDDEATESPRKKQRLSSHLSDAIDFSRLPPELKSQLFEVTWKGIVCAGQLQDAKSFLHDLRDRLDEEDLDMVQRSLRTMYDDIVRETSWEAWAAAFTAAEFLNDEYQNDDTFKMIRRIQHEAASRQREIVCQSVSEGQQDYAYVVLDQLRRYYELEIRRERKKHPEGKQEKKLNDDLIEVVQATLRLAILEHQWVKAYLQVSALLNLDGDVDSFIQKLENILSSAISENRWTDATRIVLGFKEVPDYTNVAKESLDRLRSQWYGTEGGRWTTGNELF